MNMIDGLGTHLTVLEGYRQKWSVFREKNPRENTRTHIKGCKSGRKKLRKDEAVFKYHILLIRRCVVFSVTECLKAELSYNTLASNTLGQSAAVA